MILKILSKTTIITSMPPRMPSIGNADSPFEEVYATRIKAQIYRTPLTKEKEDITGVKVSVPTSLTPSRKA